MKKKISVFSPFHQSDTSYLKVAYESLLKQTYTNWEWVLVLNGNALTGKPDLSFLQDSRVQIFNCTETGNIGKLKNYCCSKATGEILAELDYDDILTPNCLEEVNSAFFDSNIQMCYSNSCEFHNGTWLPNTYSEYWGWRTRPFVYQDGEVERTLIEMISWPPSAQSFRRIEFAPNHIRCWRKTSYDEMGGHNVELKVADDHDLCCRTYIKYGAEGIKHINRCLYLYRVHPINNVKLLNAEIQNQTHINYLTHHRQLAARWSKDNNLRMIDLGGRFGADAGYETVDLQDADIICNLNGRWKFKDNSVGVIRASHVLEHLKDSIHAMNEAYRVLAPGGFLFIDVPSTDGRGAWQDPTHISYWNENSLWYYTNDFYAKYIRPQYRGRFQIARQLTWFPSEFEKKNNISILQADLICLKPPYSDRQVGEKLI